MTQAERIAALEKRVDDLAALVDDLRRRVRKGELAREARKAGRDARAKVSPTVDGKCIRAAREAAGWTQKQLGDALGIWQTTITTYEQGRVRVSQKMGRAIVKVFRSAGADPPDFVGLDLDD